MGRISNKPALVTVNVLDDVNVSNVHDSPPTVMVDDVPPVAVP